MRIHRHALVRIRELSGFSQVDLAAASGISPQYLNDIERGRKVSVHPAKVRALAGALKCRVADLLYAPDDERVS